APLHGGLCGDKPDHRPQLCLAGPPDPIQLRRLEPAARTPSGNPGSVTDQVGGRVGQRGAHDVRQGDAWPVWAGRDAGAARTSGGLGVTWLRRFVRRYPWPAVFGIVALLFILLGLLAPWVSPDDPLRPNVQARAQAPNWQHWLGTDFIGRDVLSRIVHGAKWSLFVAITSVLLGTTVGAVWAVASAYLGGTFDLLG